MGNFIIIVVLAVVAYLVYRGVTNRDAADKAAAPKAEPKVSSEVKPKPASSETKSSAPAAKSTAEKAKPAAAKKASTAKPAAKPAAKQPAAAPAVTADIDVPASVAKHVAELADTKEPVARHRLFQQITETTYKARKNKADREACKAFSEQHMAEFGKIKAPLKKSNGGKLPQVMTFQNYANLLQEDGDFDGAVAVCEQALAHGLDDKTQTGFKGRIERIKAKAAKA